jgi:hypothetical protein
MAPLINIETGEIDLAAVAERAHLRAAREYGSPNFPPNYLRSELQWCRDRAEAERINWRLSHGLPDEEPGVAFTSYAPDTNE